MDKTGTFGDLRLWLACFQQQLHGYIFSADASLLGDKSCLHFWALLYKYKFTNDKVL
jgi:hypothetical protein